MITCYPIIYRKLVETKTKYKELAAIANIDIFTLHLKMLGIKRWKLTEVVSICCFFNTQDAEHLFDKKFRIVCI